MQDLILYLGMAAIGYIIASRLRNSRDKFGWTGKVQTAAIIILVFTMGARMGSNSEVTDNLTSIGLYSFIITVVVMTVCVVFAILARKIVGVNRYGGVGEVNPADINHGSGHKGKGGFDRMTFIIVGAVAVGMGSGYLFVDRLFSDYDTFDSAAGLAIKIGLCVMLFFVGFGISIVYPTTVSLFRRYVPLSLGARVTTIAISIASILDVIFNAAFGKAIDIFGYGFSMPFLCAVLALAAIVGFPALIRKS